MSNQNSYLNQQLAIRHQTKEELLKSIISKHDAELSGFVKDEIFRANDKQVEALVYGYCPMIQSKRFNVQSIIARQKLQIQKKEIQLTMRNLSLKQNVIPIKEYEEKLRLLQQKIDEISRNIENLDDALEIEKMLGLQKEQQARTVKNLADFLKNNKTKEELQKEKKEAEDFIKKINNQRSEFRNQMERIQKRKNQHIKELEQKHAMEQQEKLMMQKKEKQEQVEKFQKELKIKDELRKKENQEQAIKVQEILNAKPLYMQKEEKYKVEEEKSYLDKQQEYIKNVKEIRRPIELKEIEDHRVKYLEAKRFKELKLQKDREKFLDEVEERARLDELRLKKYLNKSPMAMQMYEKEIQDQEEKEREKEVQRKKMQERVQNYSHYVREMYFPKISLTKKEELEELKNHIKTTIRTSKASSSQRQSLTDLHNDNITSKSMVNSHSANKLSIAKYNHRKNNENNFNAKTENSIESQSNSNNHQPKIKRVDWTKFENKLKPQTPTQLKPTQYHDSTTDYLKDQRVKRSNYSVNPNMAFIERQLNNNDKMDKEKLDLIKDRARQIERRAAMDEKILRNDNNRTVEDEMAVNDMYLDAITAKLRLLDRI